MHVVLKASENTGRLSIMKQTVHGEIRATYGVPMLIMFQFPMNIITKEASSINLQKRKTLNKKY